MSFHRNIHYNKSDVFREEQASSASLCITATMCLIYRFALLRHSLGHLPYKRYNIDFSFVETVCVLRTRNARPCFQLSIFNCQRQTQGYCGFYCYFKSCRQGILIEPFVAGVHSFAVIDSDADSGDAEGERDVAIGG